MEVAQSLPLKYKIDAPRTKIALRAAADREIRSYTAEKKKLGFPISNPCLAQRRPILQPCQSDV